VEEVISLKKMTESTEIQSFILLFAFPFCLLSESATLKVYTSLVDYEALFNDDGVKMLSYNLDDSGILCNKIKVSGSMGIEGVRITRHHRLVLGLSHLVLTEVKTLSERDIVFGLTISLPSRFRGRAAHRKSTRFHPELLHR